jgi:hypothetical protein
MTMRLKIVIVIFVFNFFSLNLQFSILLIFPWTKFKTKSTLSSSIINAKLMANALLILAKVHIKRTELMEDHIMKKHQE